MPSTVTVTKLTIPTYPESPSETLPMFAETRVHQRSSGNPYPNAVVIRTREKQITDRVYTAVLLENEYVQLTILPELGGRVFRALDKRNGYDFFYKQSVIKPALIGALGSWISGGIEFNWPYHHRPSTFLPVDFSTEIEPDGTASVHLSEHDPFDRMKGMVTIRLAPGSTVFETAAEVYNRSPERHSFLWWENAAAPVNEDYHIFFPEDVGRVYFHYRRNETTYPLASGRYNGHDFDEPTDVSRHGNTRFATSYFCDKSDYDFFGGYDKRRGCGVVHYANRHTSPGKKLFTWGYGQLSRSWERALTDTDGAYAELMASSYSSNQPDFSWLEPYETKTFSQFWYPVKDTGIPDFANRDLTLTVCPDAAVLSATRTIRGAMLTVTKNGETVAERSLDLSPEAAVRVGGDFTGCSFRVTEGVRTLLSYEKKERIPLPASTIGDLPLPSEVKSASEAYLTGTHMLQYRDPKSDPELYFKRALDFDPSHPQALTALGECRIRRKDYAAAKAYLERAEKALTLFNRRPESGKVFYLLGLCAERMGQPDEAAERYWEAAVITDTTAAAYTRLAALDGLRGDYDAMFADASYALTRGSRNYLAKTYAALAKRALGDEEAFRSLIGEILKADPLYHTARALTAPDFSAGLHSSPTQTCIDVYTDLAEAGFKTEGEAFLRALILSGKADAMAYYLLGETPAAPLGRTFPHRDCEKEALRAAGTPEADYLLGCALYNERKYDEAAALWKPLGTPEAKRDLALYRWRKGEVSDALALLREAYAAKPDEQLLWELTGCLNRVGQYEEVVSLMENADPDTVRDDLFLEYVHANNKLGRYEKALALLLSHDFIPCEGGEPAVTTRYIEAVGSIADKAFASGDFKAALAGYRRGQVIPENLGAGLWNDAPLMPLVCREGLCLKALGDAEAAKECFVRVISMEVDFFSNMQEPLLPIWQATALRALGRNAEAEALAAETLHGFEHSRRLADGGYFTTTPFFNCYIDDPAKARDAHFGSLIERAKKILG